MSSIDAFAYVLLAKLGSFKRAFNWFDFNCSRAIIKIGSGYVRMCADCRDFLHTVQASGFQTIKYFKYLGGRHIIRGALGVAPYISGLYRSAANFRTCPLGSTKLGVPLLEEIPRKCATSLAVAREGAPF